MTNQEAVRILDEQRRRFMDEYVDFGGVNEAYNMAIDLLKKKEPQKVINRYAKWNSVLMGNCPKCNAVLHEFDNAKACGVCGQQVEWK